VYKEALRQRASKYILLSQLINQKDMKDHAQKEFSDHIMKLLHPHYISEHTERKKNTQEGWGSLRKGRKR
jgi:hypothetical protein